MKRDEVVEMVRANFGTWERGNYKPEIPREPEQNEPRTAHVDWNTPTLPYVTVAFHNPAYSDEQKDYAALDLLSAVAFGENSELYQKLVLKEQKVDALEPVEPRTPGPASVHGHGPSERR